MKSGVAFLLERGTLGHDSCDVSRSIGRTEVIDCSIHGSSSHRHLGAFTVTVQVACPGIHEFEDLEATWAEKLWDPADTQKHSLYLAPDTPDCCEQDTDL